MSSRGDDGPTGLRHALHQHAQYAELSAERLNLFLQHAAEQEAHLAESMEGGSSLRPPGYPPPPLPSGQMPFAFPPGSPRSGRGESLPPDGLDALGEGRRERWLQIRIACRYIKSFFVHCKPFSKDQMLNYLRISLPHIGLVALSALYTLLGAVVFWHLEKPHEISVRNDTLLRLQDLRSTLISRLWNMSQTAGADEGDWADVAEAELFNLSAELWKPYIRDYLTPNDLDPLTGPDEHKIHWSFVASIFFSWTAITTIGYGHIVPRTFEGRIVCLVYSLVGIPLILVTIADMGRFLSGGIIWVHQQVRKFNRWFCGNMCRCCSFFLCCICRRRKAAMTDSQRDKAEKIRQLIARADKEKRRRKKKRKKDDPPESPEKADTFEDISEINSRGQGSPAKTLDGDTLVPDEFNQEDFMREEAESRRVSVTFILVILVGYTSLGAALIRQWEEWSFFDAFYFCFVTVTTIGFGDIVPTKENYFWATLAYIILGLIITTMCIDLVGSEYIRDIHFYGRNMGRLAQQALLNFGGKVVHLGEVFGYVAFLQRNYGITPEQLDKLANLPDNYLLDCLIHGRQPNVNWGANRPFIPQDIYYFKWIEHPRTTSYVSERLFASMESIDVTSRCSTQRTPREYYQQIMMQYCKQDNETHPLNSKF